MVNSSKASVTFNDKHTAVLTLTSYSEYTSMATVKLLRLNFVGFLNRFPSLAIATATTLDSFALSTG
jgi:hypothetical protein